MSRKTGIYLKTTIFVFIVLFINTFLVFGGQAYESPDKRVTLNSMIKDICAMYNNDVTPSLVKSVIYYESEGNPNAKTGDCLGLMQVSKRWHLQRAEKLGVTNFFDSYSNILLGVDYLSELMERYKDPKLVLMLYNMNHSDAFRLYREGKISGYAKSVLAKSKAYKKGE